MSDGPHRCLSLRKPWKNAAHAADSSAFSEEQVENRVSQAIRNDWAKEVPASVMATLRQLFGTEAELSIIPPAMETAAALRRLAPGSALVATLADCAEDAIARGLTGDAAIQDIARAALEERAERSLRHIQEIYQRESSDGRARDVVRRLSSPLGRAVSKLTQDLVQAAGPIRAAPIKRFTGIEEGPPL